MMAKYLIGLHETWKAFIASESSEKIQQALHKQIRPSGEIFLTDEKVYFLREYKWHGAGWVIRCGGHY